MSTFYWLPTDYNVKSFNKHAALDLIRFSASGLSRADLAEKMGLTRAAVTLIVNDLLESGVNLRQIQVWLGHNSPAVTSVYTHLTEQATSAAAQQVGRLMEVLA